MASAGATEIEDGDMKRATALCLGLLLGGVCLGAENWPQFRGPDGTGHADEANLPVTWGGKQNVAWRTEIPGTGWSSPVIWGNQVWMTTGDSNGLSLRAVCVDKTTGKIVHNVEVFKRQTPMVVNAKNSHASPTPAIEAGRLYVSFGAGGNACLDTADGRIVWSTQELQLDHMEGPGSSPILYRDLFILACDGTDVQYVAALKKETGKLAWKTPRSGKLRTAFDMKKAFCTPQIVSVEGQDQLILPGADWIYGYEPLTGKEIWKLGCWGFSTTPRPVAGLGLAFVATGFPRPEFWAVKLGGKGDVTKTNVAWKITKNAPLKPSPLLVGDELYLLAETGFLTCLDAKTGQEIWKHRAGANFSASPIVASGRIYVCSEEGKVAVLAAGKEAKQLAVNEMNEKIMASPAVSGDALFIRTDKALYRIEGKP
jgi:outer membrane protein assembly factor BamB